MQTFLLKLSPSSLLPPPSFHSFGERYPSEINRTLAFWVVVFANRAIHFFKKERKKAPPEKFPPTGLHRFPRMPGGARWSPTDPRKRHPLGAGIHAAEPG